MSREHVDHKDIARFGEEKVNLHRDKAATFRAQAQRLRDRLEEFIKENPDFSLRRMCLSGSLAKGTALSTLNDIDVACYISGSNTPSDVKDLLEYLSERLRSAFPNISADQVQPKTFCVTVSFRGSGLDIDVVPILYSNDPNWYGKLVSQDDGSRLDTCIDRHMEFIRKRKKSQNQHFTQVVRLIKFWAKERKKEDETYRFKSFMIELILAHLCDQGLDFSDYPEAMQNFFTYIATSNLSERIVFEDYYRSSTVRKLSDPIQIIDPVNPENNVTKLYTREQTDKIVNSAIEAGDAIDYALNATTKSETVRQWQRVFGSSFNM